jgi:hypothetical protein
MAKFLEKVWGSDSDEVVFRLANGKALSVKLADIPEATLQDLVKHGISQKVGDAAASCSKGEEFTRALEQMAAVVENLKKGLWRTEGTGGSGNSILIDALIRVTGQKRATVEAAVAAADEAKMRTWKGNAAVSAAMKQIVAERAAERAAESDEEVVL